MNSEVRAQAPLFMPALLSPTAVDSVAHGIFPHAAWRKAARVRAISFSGAAGPMLLPLVLAFPALLYGCTDEYSSPDRSVGPHGEPPPALRLAYEKQFAVANANYLKALGEVHSFLLHARLSPTFRTRCFTDVVDIHVWANTKRNADAFPCVALQATMGEATETYIRTRIDGVKFNWDRNVWQVAFTVQFYGHEGLVPRFISVTQPKLQMMHLREGTPSR